jgi:hypothetical protein
MSNVAKASSDLKKELDPDLDAIMDAGDSSLDKANASAKTKFWDGLAW